jgi:hypothetical protein
MPPEGMEAVSIGGCDERFMKPPGHARGSAVRIQRPLVKMAELDGVETILFREQPPADRAAENVKWMRRDGEKRLAAPGAKRAHIREGFQAGRFFAAYIKQDNIRPFDSHFSGRDEQNSHGRGVSKNLRTIKNRVVQGNREDPKPELTRAFEELMR